MSPFATYPRGSSSSSKLSRILKSINPTYWVVGSRATLSSDRRQKYIVNGVTTLTTEQAVADTKVLMEFYHANAVWDSERRARRAGIADFSSL